MIMWLLVNRFLKCILYTPSNIYDSDYALRSVLVYLRNIFTKYMDTAQYGFICPSSERVSSLEIELRMNFL